MRSPILTDAGKPNETPGMPSGSAATGRFGEARATAEGPRPCSQTAPARCSAHKMSAVDGPFPETKQ